MLVSVLCAGDIPSNVSAVDEPSLDVEVLDRVVLPPVFNDSLLDVKVLDRVVLLPVSNKSLLDAGSGSAVLRCNVGIAFGSNFFTLEGGYSNSCCCKFFVMKMLGTYPSIFKINVFFSACFTPLYNNFGIAILNNSRRMTYLCRSLGDAQ